MSRALTIGNGNLLIGLDDRAQVRDFYFPYVGHSNHVSGASGSYTHRIGVWVEGTCSWFSYEDWEIEVSYDKSSGAGNTTARNDALGVSLHFTDVVHNEKNIFLRKITLTNERSSRREIKIFFGQEFRISESRRGDTAFYDPRVRAIVHYKGHHSFLVYAMHDGHGFADYSVGLFGIEDKAGTYIDAEDGMLSQNPIEHGSVDSVIGIAAEVDGGATTELQYWVVAARTIEETHALHREILKDTPERIIRSTISYWEAWKGKEEKNFSVLNDGLVDLYLHSLAVIRVHADNRGGIIASSDSDMLNHGRDTYSYVWPRDGAYIANALDRAGHIEASQRFFAFMAKCLEKDGYFMHKYRVDGVLGSSWHPWVQQGVARLPIQEDETAIMLYMLGEHYKYAKDLEFIENLYNTFIEPASEFLCTYVEAETGLPVDSYDLWEEKYGSSTYTAATVYGALNATALLAGILGKRENAKRYQDRAALIKRAILTYLYDPHTNIFRKLVRHEGGQIVKDDTFDMSSLFGMYRFEVLGSHDKRFRDAVETMSPKLKVDGKRGGYVRYVGDQYYRVGPDASSNPWTITTLWMAQLHIQTAETLEALTPAHDLITMVYENRSKSGMLAEQIDPQTGNHLSASPLVWSHAEYIITVDEYLKKYSALHRRVHR